MSARHEIALVIDVDDNKEVITLRCSCGWQKKRTRTTMPNNWVVKTVKAHEVDFNSEA